MENIAKAINNVMEEVNGVAKNMTVGAGNNSYKGVSDKDVKIKIRESMIKNGLSIIPIGGNPKIQIDRWEEETNWGAKQKQSVFTEIDTKYLLIHTSGETVEVWGYGHGVDAQDKGAGKATTYALKNTLLNMFLIPTGIDTDNTHSEELDVPKKDDKPWFNKPQLEKLRKVKDQFNSGQDALNVARSKYKVGNEMQQEILDLYK